MNELFSDKYHADSVLRVNATHPKFENDELSHQSVDKKQRVLIIWGQFYQLPAE